MTMDMDYSELVPATGQAICHRIAFTGYELDQGKGTIDLNTVIRKIEDDGTFTYHKPSDKSMERITCDTTDMLEVAFRDGLGGEITGIQILNGLAHMVEKHGQASSLIPLRD